jgi:hypothetical protein
MPGFYEGIAQFQVYSVKCQTTFPHSQIRRIRAFAHFPFVAYLSPI